MPPSASAAAAATTVGSTHFLCWTTGFVSSSRGSGFVGPVVVTVGMAVVTVGWPLFSARCAARPSPPAVP